MVREKDQNNASYKKVGYAGLVRALVCGWIVAISPIAQADHLDDIRNWRTGLPMVAHWNTGGHNPDWHVNQVRNGGRVLPTIKYDILTQITKDKTTGLYLGTPPAMSDANKAFIRDNKLPICLRTDNTGSIAVQWPRVPKLIENVNLSAVPFAIMADGTIDDRGVPDYFADPAMWRQWGKLWGSSRYMKTIQDTFPDVPYFLFADNNEINQKVVDYLANVFDSRGRSVYDLYGNQVKKYKTDVSMSSMSIRFADYTKDHTVDEFQAEFYRRRIALYQEIFGAFDASLVQWQGKMLTECYSGIASNGTGGDVSYTPYYSHNRAIFDGGGPPVYVKTDDTMDTWNHTGPSWFRFSQTIPAFEQAERNNSSGKEFRELFLTISPTGATKGKTAGLHEVITPDLHSASIQWLLWSNKGVRIPFLIRYWTGNGETPSTPVTDAYTKQDYFTAAVKAVNTICDNTTLREFWLNGEPVVTGKHPQDEIRQYQESTQFVYPLPEDPDTRWRLLNVDTNTPRSQWIIQPGTNNRGGYNSKLSIKVWSVAVKLDGRYLVYMWSPCALSGTCKFTIPDVGTFEVPVPSPQAYYLVERDQWKVKPTL